MLAAVATPTPDPVTMTLAMGPLILLYEASILLARWLDRVSPRVSRWDLDDDLDDDVDELDDDPEEISLDGSDDRGSRHDRED